MLLGVGSRGALHFRARLDANRLTGVRHFLGDDLELLGDLDVLPGPGPLALVLSLCGFLSLVALPKTQIVVKPEHLNCEETQKLILF